MLTPRNHSGSTKSSWISFYNEEAAKVVQEYRDSLTPYQEKTGKLFPMSSRDFKREWSKTRAESGISLKVKDLRDWFCSEMGSLGESDRYVDAFCGRVPRSILARHYTDYSPERLKEICEKTNIKVLNNP